MIEEAVVAIFAFGSGCCCNNRSWGVSSKICNAASTPPPFASAMRAAISAKSGANPIAINMHAVGEDDDDDDDDDDIMLSNSTSNAGKGNARKIIKTSTKE